MVISSHKEFTVSFLPFTPSVQYDDCVLIKISSRNITRPHSQEGAPRDP
jgi:hypothetical protein